MEVKKINKNRFTVIAKENDYYNSYIVDKLELGWQCTCIDFFEHGNCDHIRAVKKHLKLI